MLKKFLVLFKKVIYNTFLIYCYNLFAISLNLIIPINVITVGLLTIFGYPMLISLIVILILVY
ncbi:MAG: hypothetical protein GX190_00120 [Mollicutes bacterium]|nr:hypothetical protein [Mollicutes bacterium]